MDFAWYYNDGTQTKLISQKDSKTAERFATQKYLTLKLKELQQEKSAIQAYLHNYNPADLESEKLLLHPGYARLLASHFKPQNKL